MVQITAKDLVQLIAGADSVDYVRLYIGGAVICQIICPRSAKLFVLFSATLFVLDSQLLTS